MKREQNSGFLSFLFLVSTPWTGLACVYPGLPRQTRQAGLVPSPNPQRACARGVCRGGRDGGGSSACILHTLCSQYMSVLHQALAAKSLWESARDFLAFLLSPCRPEGQRTSVSLTDTAQLSQRAAVGRDGRGQTRLSASSSQGCQAICLDLTRGVQLAEDR